MHLICLWLSIMIFAWVMAFDCRLCFWFGFEASVAGFELALAFGCNFRFGYDFRLWVSLCFGPLALCATMCIVSGFGFLVLDSMWLCSLCEPCAWLYTWLCIMSSFGFLASWCLSLCLNLDTVRLSSFALNFCMTVWRIDATYAWYDEKYWQMNQMIFYYS